MNNHKIYFDKYTLTIESKKRFAGNAVFYLGASTDHVYTKLCALINKELGINYKQQNGKGKRYWGPLSDTDITKLDALAVNYNAVKNKMTLSSKENAPSATTPEKNQVLDTSPNMLAEEIREPEKFIEGATISISINTYERNTNARKKCLEHHGHKCSVCGFDFGEAFGELGEGFIHVHHLKPLAEIDEEYQLNPMLDLMPVCPNCHSMLHRRTPALGVAELRLLRNRMQSV